MFQLNRSPAGNIEFDHSVIGECQKEFENAVASRKGIWISFAVKLDTLFSNDLPQNTLYRKLENDSKITGNQISLGELLCYGILNLLD